MTFGKCLLLSDLFSRKQIGAGGVACACVCLCVHVMCSVSMHVVRGRGVDYHQGSPSFGFPKRSFTTRRELPPKSTSCKKPFRGKDANARTLSPTVGRVRWGCRGDLAEHPVSSNANHWLPDIARQSLLNLTRRQTSGHSQRGGPTRTNCPQNHFHSPPQGT